MEKDSAVLSAYILPIENATGERSYERFLVFSQAKKQVFFKNTQNQRAKLIFFKMSQNSFTVCMRKKVECHKTYTTVLGLALELNLIVVKKHFR